MRIKLLTALNVLLATVLLASIFFGVSTSQPPFDPWLDNTDDGYGGIDDIVVTAEHFGASGDPIKLCNITNWPESNDVNVWWNWHIEYGAVTASPLYDSCGYGRINILAYVAPLGGGETVEFQLMGRLITPDGFSGYSITIFTFTMSALSSTSRYYSMEVPSGTFWFTAGAGETTTADIYLSFYLTWA
jgi:hypothetical protein